MSSNNTQIEYDNKIPLGQGGFGSVFPGKYKGRQVAVKRVQLHLVYDNEEKALQCLQQLGHPNIVKLFYSESDANFKFFALELCAASLDQLFLKPENYKGFKLPHHLTVIFHLASGLSYIHSKGLFHRDIKPANVLIFIDSTTGLVTMKWADFGLSKFVNERGTCTLSGIKGTECYYAPELLRSLEKKNTGRGTIKSDVFSFALVIGYLLLDGHHLYGTNYGILINIVNKSPVNMDKINGSHYALDLLKKMLKDDPDKRISSEEVVKELESIKIEIPEKEEEFRQQFKNKNLDLNRIEFLIENGIDVNGKSNSGWNALHYLCSYNSSFKLIDGMQFLVQKGIDVNGKTKEGWNALHLLCQNNSSEKIVDAIQFLILNGIDVNGKDTRGVNALQLLCGNNSSEKLIDAIQVLILNGIDVNGKDNNGWNALHWLCYNKKSEKIVDVMQVLIEKGIEVNGKINGWNALHSLCRYNSSEKLIDAIRFLIQNGIDVNGKINYGWNALHFLCRFNSSEKLIDAMQFLIQNGIDVNEKDNNGRNALHFLCWNNSSEKLIDAIKLLIQNGIDVNGKDKKGENALHLLCWNHRSEKLIDAIEFLIQNGIDVNEKEKYGRNALHLLCRENSSYKLIDAMEFLIQNGIDVNEKDNNGRNALHYLCDYNKSEKIVDAIRLLMKHGIQSNGLNARSLLRYNRSINAETVEEIVHLLDTASIVPSSN